MDRISTLRNVEDALRKFERGEADLVDTERAVVTALRTYATDFEASEVPGDGDADADGAGDASARAAYRVAIDPGDATGAGGDGGNGGNEGNGERDDGDRRAARRTETVVVAESTAAARELALEHLDARDDAGPGDVEADRI